MPIPASTRTTEPASIPAEILKEIESFEEEAAKVLNAEVSSDVFRPFRLQHGIYGQRQPGVQMVRIKIPFGGLDAKQVRAIAEIVEDFDDRVAQRQQILHRKKLAEHLGEPWSRAEAATGGDAEADFAVGSRHGEEPQIVYRRHGAVMSAAG